MEGFLNPKEVLEQLDLKADMVAVDFGSGSGGWVIPLAEKLEQGKVYAVDVLEAPLSALKSKASMRSLSNIETIIADVEKGVKILEGSCNLVLMTNLLFEVDDKQRVFNEANRVLAKGGQILVIDWLADAPLGPKEGRVKPQEVKVIAQEAGFKLEKEFSAGKYHWGLLFAKS